MSAKYRIIGHRFKANAQSLSNARYIAIQHISSNDYKNIVKIYQRNSLVGTVEYTYITREGNVWLWRNTGKKMRIINPMNGYVYQR